jgi:hypothetical protein
MEACNAGNLLFQDKAPQIFQLTRLLSDPDWIRTSDRQFRKLLLYPAELPGQNATGAKVGFFVNFFELFADAVV